MTRIDGGTLETETTSLVNIISSGNFTMKNYLNFALLALYKFK